MPRWNFFNTRNREEREMPAINVYSNTRIYITRNRNEEEIRPAVTATRSWLAADNTNDVHLEWHPVRWNATQFFPDNEDTPARVHDMNISGLTQQMLENAYNNMTARDYFETASATAPENMLRLVRLSMPNLTRNTLVEETPMEVLEDSDYARWTSLYSTNWGNMYNNHKENYSGRKFVYKNGKLKVIKRYCKI